MVKKSQLLFDEHPLVINPKLAQMIGLNEAIVLQQVHYWVTLNEKAGKNIRDDFTWTYNTYKEWNLQFPFWSLRTIKTIFANLERKGLLISGNFNKVKQDRTKWYRVSLDAYTLQSADIAPSEEADIAPPKGRNDPLEEADIAPPLPETNAETTPKTTTESKEDKTSSTTITRKEVHEVFIAMREYYGYPERTKIDPVPNYGKEGKAIKRMLERGFDITQIISCWMEKVKKAGQFKSMVYVNEDIGQAPSGNSQRDYSKQKINYGDPDKYIKGNYGPMVQR